MVDPAVRNTIVARLRSVEEAESVRVIYACESGSRAWGFASSDSDYDVRFIFAHTKEWYLSIDDGSDVSEHNDGLLDISGWDIRKTLRLLRKSNPPLLEWLRSPIVYLEEPTTTGRIRGLATSFFSLRSCLHHYLHMAEGNYREYLRGSEVKVKKYFYVLRPLLACMWIEANNAAPPMEFEELLRSQTLDDRLAAEIDRLLSRKRAGTEMDIEPRIDVMNEFIEATLSHFSYLAKNAASQPTPETRVLDELFRETITSPW